MSLYYQEKGLLDRVDKILQPVMNTKPSQQWFGTDMKTP